MASESPLDERIVGSVASLLSSAVTFNGDGLEVLDTESSATIPRFLSTTVTDDADVCSIPSLRLKHSKTASLSDEESLSIEDAASRNLALPVILNRSEVENAPVILLASLSDSFMCLVDSRVRSAVGALLRKSQHQTDPTLSRVIVGLLASSSNPIAPTAVVTSFRVLPSSHRPSHGECVLPLVMETVVDMNILGNLITINLVTPGTIQGSFCQDTYMLTKIQVTLDTSDFLKAMMTQARFVVRNAMRIATDTASKILLPSSVMMSSDSLSDMDVPNPVALSEMDLPTPIGSASSLTGALEQDNRSSMASPALMPPPPRRAPNRGLSFSRHHESSSFASIWSNSVNASWPTPESNKNTTSTGISMLTAAAAGMKHSIAAELSSSDGNSCKRQRLMTENAPTASSQSQESSRVPSFPSLSTPV